MAALLVVTAGVSWARPSTCGPCGAERRQCRAARLREVRTAVRACRGRAETAACRATARARLQIALQTCGAARAACVRCCQATGAVEGCLHSRLVASCTSNADCDDANVCTEDLCDPFLGCVHSDISAACDDGNACTAADVCTGGVCIGGNVAAGCAACQAVATIPPQGGTVLGQTSGGGGLTGSCSQSDTSGERVYAWTPATSGQATIQTCGSATLYDTVLYLRQGSCAAGAEMACNDDTPGCGTGEPSDGHGSTITPAVVAGVTYYIVVDGFAGATGNFTLTVFPPSVCGNGVQEGAEACDGAASAGCQTGQCTAQCTCVPPAGGEPDLTAAVSDVQVAFDATVDPGDVVEGCAPRLSGLDLVRFTVTTRNVGTADFLLGDPQCPSCVLNPNATCGNPEFICAPAGGHQHAHYQNYARYELLDGGGQTVAIGHKQGFCLEDAGCATAKFDCAYQGLTPTCSDVYAANLGCQYVDVTNLASGSYTLRVTVDPFDRVPELSESNNVATVPVVIPLRGVPTGSCATPTIVPAGGGTLQGVTGGPSTEAGTCAATGVSGEQVFVWTPAASGVATIETCGGATAFDTVVYLRPGQCNAAELACNDDTAGCGAAGDGTTPHRGSHLTPAVVAGQTYYVFVDGFGGANGAFTLRIVPPGGVPPTTTTVTTTSTTVTSTSVPGTVPATTSTSTSSTATSSSTPGSTSTSTSTSGPPTTSTSSSSTSTSTSTSNTTIDTSTTSSSSTTSSTSTTTSVSSTSSTSTTSSTRPPNRAPVCAAAVAVPRRLAANGHELVDVQVAGITDPDGDPVVTTITAIRQDEPVQGPGSGNTCPDADGVGTSHARVRAERSGGGDGRVYRLSVRATDGRGGRCATTVAVCVPHDQGRGGRCVDEGPSFNSTPPCSRRR